jgi:(S)-2-hydroxy-acid oxidase
VEYVWVFFVLILPCSLRENEEAFNYFKIQPRILVNVDNIDISGEIFGFKTALPLAMGPAAMHKLAHPDGELATSRAAANLGVCMGLSSYATESIENVAAVGKGNPYVMQLSVLKDRNTTLQMLQRAEGKSCFHYQICPRPPYS